MFSWAARLHEMGGHLQAALGTVHEVHGDVQLGHAHAENLSHFISK